MASTIPARPTAGCCWGSKARSRNSNCTRSAAASLRVFSPRLRAGELALTLPVGLMRVSGDLVVKDADVEVQERLRLVFQSFLRLRTAAKVMRMFNAQGLDLPRRDRHGDLRWTRASVSAVIAILKNPAYAGAFVYGRRQASAVTS